MYSNTVDFASVRTNITTLRSKFVSTENLNILDVVESDLAILEEWWDNIVEFNDINGASNPLDPATAENYMIDRLEESVGVVAECIKVIDARIEAKSNRDMWGDLFKSWLTLSNNIIVNMAEVTATKFDIQSSALHTAKNNGSIDNLAADAKWTADNFYPIYSFRDTAALKLSIEVAYDRFVDLGTQIAHSLYTGDSYDAGSGKYDAFTDWQQVVSKSRESNAMTENAGNARGAKLIDLLWITENDQSAPIIKNSAEIVEILANAVSRYGTLVNSFNLMSQTLVQYFSTPRLRWTDENRSNVSQSIKMLNEAQKMRNETFDYFQKYVVGAGRTFLEINKHLIS